VDIVEETHKGDSERFTYDFDNYLETGFQLATFRGPLCAEPVEGLAYFVESLDIDGELLDIDMCASALKNVCFIGRVLMDHIAQNRMAQVTGSMVSAVRESCRNGLLDWSPRLMLAMYTCNIQASSKNLFFRRMARTQQKIFSGCSWESVQCGSKTPRTHSSRRNERGDCVF